MRPGRTDRGIIGKGPANSYGWVNLTPGLPLVCPPVPHGDVLGVIWHLSDVHICDAESPARLEYLDRFSDPDSPYAHALGDVGTYRPQEILTVQVAATMVETVNDNARGPTTDRVADVVLLTGDLIDNAQENELQWYQTIVQGGEVAPVSGDGMRSSWVGSPHIQWDDRYWHPDGPSLGQARDRLTRVHGFPEIPGLVDAARAPVHSPGLRLPWISVYGNHDGLLQGTVAPTSELQSLAVGGERVTGLPPGMDPMEITWAIAKHGPARYIHTDQSPRMAVAADGNRRLITGREFATATGAQATFFAMDVAELRIICLNTVNPYGGWEGSLDHPQFAWLDRELQSTDRPVVIASHHPSFTLTNDYVPAGSPSRVLRDEVLDLLLDSDQVVLWLAGHVHHHSLTRHARNGHAFLEITTASLIDWPQQGSMIEILRVKEDFGSHVVVVSTAVDHQAPVMPNLTNLHDHRNLAAVSRLLSANDYHQYGVPKAESAGGALNGWWSVASR